MRRTLALVTVVALAMVLSACAYDYLQRSDRIAYSAGDAVNANLEGSTINPSSTSMNDKTGLGKDGLVITPAETEAP